MDRSIGPGGVESSTRMIRTVISLSRLARWIQSHTVRSHPRTIVVDRHATPRHAMAVHARPIRYSTIFGSFSFCIGHEIDLSQERILERWRYGGLSW